MNINEKIGARIKSLRNEQKLAQSALAIDADINRTYLNSVEKGERKISVQTLEKILKAMDINFVEFFSHQNFNE